MFRRILHTGSSTAALTFGRHRGFTLVEVMMSTVLVAVATSLAAPSYRSMIEKRQLTQSAEQLAAFVSSVQSISTRSNQVVTVSYTRTSHHAWCIGAVIGTTACNCNQTVPTAGDYCAIDGQNFVLDEGLSNGSDLVHSMTGGAYSFDPIRGLSDASLTMELHTDSRKFKLNLMVNSTGRVILCSKDSDHAVPGYEPCTQVVEITEPIPLPEPLPEPEPLPIEEVM